MAQVLNWTGMVILGGTAVFACAVIVAGLVWIIRETFRDGEYFVAGPFVTLLSAAIGGVLIGIGEWLSK